MSLDSKSAVVIGGLIVTLTAGVGGLGAYLARPAPQVVPMPAVCLRPDAPPLPCPSLIRHDRGAP